MKINNALLSALTLGILLCGCNFKPVTPQKQTGFKADYASTNVSTQWWKSFNDPQLNALIQSALEQNSDLQTALNNVEYARVNLGLNKLEYLPNVNLSGSAVRQNNFGNRPDRNSHGAYQIGAVLSYEIDLWGRVRNSSQAALQQYFSTAASRDATHLSLIASVAKAYFNEQYATAAMALSEKTLASYQKTYDLAKVRHKAGVISALDLRSQEAMIENAKASYAAAVRAREQARNALELLISQKIPDDLPAPLALSKQFKIRNLPAGLPSDLLLNRPDIIAAEHTLKAANANIGVARAAFFPTISLTSTLGFGSSQLSNLFNSSNKTWSYGGNLSLPIFDWGQRRNQLKVSKIEQEKAVVAYEAAVEGAFRDVADALVARAAMNTQYDSNLAQQKAYNERLRLTTLRYKHGVSSALDLLDAQRSSYSADTTVLSTQLSLLENLADLYKALGGGLKRYSTDDATTQQEIKAAKTAVQTSKQATAQ